MAIELKQKQDELNTQSQPAGIQQAPQMGGPQSATITNAAGGSTAPTGTPGAPAAAPGAAPKTGSGRFTNLQRYIQANQGSGERLANKIGQRFNSQVDMVNQSVKDASGVKNQLQAERDRIAQSSGFANQLTTDPTALVGKENEPEKFEKFNQFQGLLKGQNNLQTISQTAQQKFDAANSNFNTLQEQAKATATEKGRFDLLKQTLGRPTYNTGQQRLDQLMIQGGGNGALNSLQRQTQQTLDDRRKAIDSTIADVDGFGNLVSKEARDAQTMLNTKLTEATANANKTYIDDELAAADMSRQEIQGKRDLINKILAGEQDQADWTQRLGATPNGYVDPKGKQSVPSSPGMQQKVGVQPLSQEQLKQLRAQSAMEKMKEFGLLDDASSNILQKSLKYGSGKGFDVTELLKNSLKYNDVQNFDRNSFISEQDAARLNALSQLAGQEGTYKAGTNQFKQAELNSDINTIKDTLNPILSKELQEANSNLSRWQQEYDKLAALPRRTSNKGGAAGLRSRRTKMENLLNQIDEAGSKIKNLGSMWNNDE